jgi:hypothetical protein
MHNTYSHPCIQQHRSVCFLRVYARRGLTSCFILIGLGCCRTTVLYNCAKCSLSMSFYMHVWFRTHANGHKVSSLLYMHEGVRLYLLFYELSS